MEIIKNAKNLDREFDELFAKMPPMKKRNIYKNDYNFAKSMIMGLYEAGFVDEEPLVWNIIGLNTSDSIYTDVWHRVLAGFDEISDICASLAPRYREIKESTLEGLVTISYVYASQSSISNILSRMVKKEVVGNPAGVSEGTDKYLDDPEYGLVPEKPIYVDGLAGGRQYLRRLRTADGKRFNIFRKGSKKVKGVDGIVDIYVTTIADNKHSYGEVYVCMYGTSNSKRAPEGYSLYSGKDSKEFSLIATDMPDF